MFSTVHAVVAADAGAQARLRDAGIAAGRWLRLGPTSAIGLPDEQTLAYDAQRWLVDEDGGELVLTNVADRLTPCDRFRTGVRGSVPEPGRLLLA